MTTLWMSKDKDGNSLGGGIILDEPKFPLKTKYISWGWKAWQNAQPYTRLALSMLMDALRHIEVIDNYYWIMSDGQWYCDALDVDYEPIRKYAIMQNMYIQDVSAYERICGKYRKA